MPIVNVSWNTKAEKNKKKELMQFIVDTISETTGTNKALVYVFFRDYEDADVSNDNCPVVQINWTIQAARSPEAKSQVIKMIADKFGELFPEVHKDRVVVIITDVPLTDAGVGGVTRAVAFGKA